MDSDLGEVIRELERLQLEQQRIIARQAHLIRRLQSTAPPVVQSSANALQYNPGDRVYITNQITHVVGRRRIVLRDRAGIITGVSLDQQGRYWATIDIYSGRRGVRRVFENIRTLTPEETLQLTQ